MNNKINLNEQKTQKKNLLIKLAETVGNKSVGKCGIWFNQPVVPKKLKNNYLREVYIL